MFDLRYYQERMIASARKKWESHQSTAIIAATGTGKTLTYLQMAVDEPGRVLVLVHRDYLITQPIATLQSAGFTNVSIEKASERSELGFHKAKIVFASIMSIGPEKQAKRLNTFNPNDFSLVIVDEAHRAVGASYRRVLDHFKTNSKVKILILTATPKRKDGRALSLVCESEAGVYGPASAIEEGWIVPVKFYRRDVQSLDFSNVRLKGTDLDPDQVQALLLQEKPLHEICASLSEDRGPTLIFCPEVAVAKAYTELMNKRYRPGSSAVLHGESPDEERELYGKKLAQGEIDYVFNCNLFTEGFDLPHLLRVVWASPTASLVKYIQGVGRVFRPHGSLKKHLTGGPEDSDRRRTLIAQSPKPFGIVVTYYPQNCKHELCDPIDILGGDELPPNVKAAARQVQDETGRQSGGSTTEADIETAKVFVELKSILDQRKKNLKAKAEFADKEFNPMSTLKQVAGVHKSSSPTKNTDAAAEASWAGGEPITKPQRGWFWFKKIPIPEGMTKMRAVVVRDLIEMGVQPATALNYSKRQAMKVRDEIKARRAPKPEEAIPL